MPTCLGTNVDSFFADVPRSLCRSCRCLASARVIAALWAAGGEMNSGDLKTYSCHGLHGTYSLTATVLLPVPAAVINPGECVLMAQTPTR